VGHAAPALLIASLHLHATPGPDSLHHLSSGLRLQLHPLQPDRGRSCLGGRAIYWLHTTPPPLHEPLQLLDPTVYGRCQRDLSPCLQRKQSWYLLTLLTITVYPNVNSYIVYAQNVHQKLPYLYHYFCKHCNCWYSIYQSFANIHRHAIVPRGMCCKPQIQYTCPTHVNCMTTGTLPEQTFG